MCSYVIHTIHTINRYFKLLILQFQTERIKEKNYYDFMFSIQHNVTQMRKNIK